MTTTTYSSPEWPSSHNMALVANAQHARESIIKRVDVFALLLLPFQYNDTELAAMREVKNRFDPL